MGIGELLSQYGGKYLTALLTTWRLTAVSFILALAIGILVTAMRVSPIRPLRIFGELYVQIFRNIPGAALLMFIAYALPYLNRIYDFQTCVQIACTLIPAAFCSEYLMSGMGMIDKGQVEAAKALGMRFTHILAKIVIPQALRFSVLPLTNLLVATMLTTSLGGLVPMNPQELTGIVSYINTHSVGGVLAFAISAALYCATAVVIGQIGNAIDRKVRILR